MEVAEFDKFAEAYLASHAENIRISGEDPEYFARYKIDFVRALWDRERRREPAAVLDFGTGIGASLPHLKTAFPGARLVGLDVSQRSLEVAERRFPGAAELVRYDGDLIPLAEGGFDLVFSACVFHHIPEAEHGRLFGQIRRLLRPGGRLVVFEHNPLNPVTRHIVATCPFDENAVLIPAPVLARRQREAGFKRVRTTFTGFFPGALRALRPLEGALGWAPLGAQYATVADA